METEMHVYTMESTPGRLHLMAYNGKLIYSGFSHPVHGSPRLPAVLRRMLQPARIVELSDSDIDRDELLFETAREFGEYLAGRSNAIHCPFALYGTGFQQGVWKKLLQVPRGTTVTYSQLALEAGHPRSVRAVGTAVGMNPLTVLVPCHRVLPAAGGIGNFGGGPEMKARLLELEGVRIPPSRSS